MNWPWPSPRRSDVLGFLFVLALVGIVLFGWMIFPKAWPWGNWGFGPEWRCSYVGQGQPVCIKEPLVKAPHREDTIEALPVPR